MELSVGHAAVQIFHWHWADPVASVTIASLIVAAVWPLVKHSAAQLLEAAPVPVSAPAAHVAAKAATEASATPPQIESALRSIQEMAGVSCLKRLLCLEVRRL